MSPTRNVQCWGGSIPRCCCYRWTHPQLHHTPQGKAPACASPSHQRTEGRGRYPDWIALLGLERKKQGKDIPAPDSKLIASTLCAKHKEAALSAQARGWHSSGALCPLTLLLHRGSGAQVRALHNQLACEGHKLLHTAKRKQIPT